MFVALIHWRIKPDDASKEAFLEHWKTNNSISDRTGLIAEFVSDTLPMASFPYITWHLDSESLGDFKSFVTIGLWDDAATFGKEVAKYFNDDKPLLPFEKYRRRRVIFSPVGWRIGATKLPTGDSPGVK
jgi:hypothetical protein